MRLAASLLFLASCLPSGSYTGKVVDGMSGKPVADVRFLAKSNPPSIDMACQTFEATSGPDGAFSFAKTCGNTHYDLVSADESLALEEAVNFDGGIVNTGEVKVWKAPSGSGLSKLAADGKLDRLATASDIVRKKFLDTEEDCTYPSNVPGKVARIEAGDYLVLASEGTIKKMNIVPVIKDEHDRRFGTSKEWFTLEPWYYAGVEFTSDKKWTRLAAQVDSAKVIDKTLAGRQMRYIPSDAVPKGRYAIFGNHDTRMYIVDFGAE